MRRRHTYGATSNIILDLRLQDGDQVYLQGDVVTARRRDPLLLVKVIGTGPLAKIDVLRDNTYVHAVPGRGESAEFVYRDENRPPGEHYYYVRAVQQDGNAAWSSPLWVRQP